MPMQLLFNRRLRLHFWKASNDGFGVHVGAVSPAASVPNLFPVGGLFTITGFSQIGRSRNDDDSSQNLKLALEPCA